MEVEASLAWACRRQRRRDRQSWRGRRGGVRHHLGWPHPRWCL